MLSFDIITIFPSYFRGVFDYGIVRRACAAQLISIEAHNLRKWTTDKHHTVDDRPFGGGDGMLLKPEPIFEAVEALTSANNNRESASSLADASANTTANRVRRRIVLLSPQGHLLTQTLARELAQSRHIVVICGRYEGVDERVAQNLATDELSIGDYVLSGGEPAAAVLVDAVARLVPGVLGSETSALNDSFSDGLLDSPHYTRPVEFRASRVPEVLLTGNHAEIKRYRRQEQLRKTWRNRPDLLPQVALGEQERQWLEEFENE